MTSNAQRPDNRSPDGGRQSQRQDRGMLLIYGIVIAFVVIVALITVFAGASTEAPAEGRIVTYAQPSGAERYGHV